MPSAARKLRREREGAWDTARSETETQFPRTPYATMTALTPDGSVPKAEDPFAIEAAQFRLSYLGDTFYTSPVYPDGATWGDVWHEFCQARNTMHIAGKLDSHRYLEGVTRRGAIGGAAAKALHSETQHVNLYSFDVGS